jgi:MFS family permease
MTHQRLVMLVFFLQPIAFGAWLPRIPDIQRALGLGSAELALALLGMPIGILLTLPFAGRFVARIGARATILYGFPVFLALVWLPTWSWSLPALLLSLAIVGIALATLELGLNVMADAVEKETRALIMSTCHGFWSLGIMSGNLIGAGLAGLHLNPHTAVILVAAVVLPLAFTFSKGLPDLRGARPDPVSKRPSSIHLPGWALLAICAFTFGVTMTEGAVADWSAVFLRDVFGAGSVQAGIGYSVFAFMVAAGRFFGDRLKARYGAVKLARACGLANVAGLVLLLVSPNTFLAFLGFAAMGVGVSVGFPLAVTAAASLADRPSASSVAILSFVALLGFLVGPPLIGFVAELGDMRLGLAMLLPAAILSLLFTGALKVRQ